MDYDNKNQQEVTLVNEITEETSYVQPEPEILIAEGGQRKKEKKKSFRKKSFLKRMAVIALAAILFGGVSGASYQGYRYLTEKEGQTNQQVADDGQQSGGQESALEKVDEDGTKVDTSSLNVTSTDVSEVVENVMPSIVAIDCEQQNVQYDMFGQQRSFNSASSGSGIIIAQNENTILIATNNHVIANASKIVIKFSDDSTAEATLKGADAYYDLAVISVDISQLSEETLGKIKIATLGDSDAMKTGSMVIAIGNALGYGQSVTVGYISALNREVLVDNATMTLLQTDAAINPGNSGGALLNVNGEVIGINSVKYSSEEVEGIGYAIPTSIAVPIINELMGREDLAEGESGYLGIVGKDISSSYEQSFGMPSGVYLYSVSEDSPAEEAGLKPGYIITGINGRDIATTQELEEILSYTRAGTTVEIKFRILEQGVYEEKAVSVVLGSRPNNAK